MISLEYGIKKKKRKRAHLQSRNRVTDVENKLWLPGGKRGGIDRKIKIDTYTLLYIKQITNEDPLYGPGDSTQYSVMAYIGKES